jgi:hypothetical protein
MRFLMLFLFLLSNESFADEWLFGTWKITGFVFSDYSALSTVEAKAYIGKTILYSRDRLEFSGKYCNKYKTTIKTNSKKSYEEQHAVSFDELGIKSNEVKTYLLDCSVGDFWEGSFIMKLGKRTASIGWDGARFKIEKIIRSSATSENVCSVVGEPVHWIADYCMDKNATDDFFNPKVQECYDREEKKMESENKNTCLVKKLYKKKLCIIKKEFYGDSWERCVRDKNFVPKSVRANGVEL